MSIIRLAAIVFLLLNVVNTSKLMRQRYFGWYNRLYMEETYKYENMDRYLDSIGIDPSAKIISRDDEHINTTLYLMDRKGWTNFGNDLSDSAKIVELLEMGADYLVYHRETDIAQEKLWSGFTGEKAGEFNNVRIYKLKHPD